MHIVAFGRTGQVGTALARLRAPGLAVTTLGREAAELTDPAGVALALAEACDRVAEPAVVVNAAAYTAVDRAEDEPALAHAVNGDGAGAIAAACARLGLPLIHLSTDYVFDGAKPAPYHEGDPVAPINVYGASKAAGEAAVRAVLDRHVILRTAWVFGSDGSNFVKTMLRLGRTRPELGIVADQIGCPTGAADIAQAAVAIARRLTQGAAPWGTYHYCGAEPVSWHGFAEAIFAGQARLGAGPVPRLRAIATSDYPTRARRPANSRLDCSRLAQAFAVPAPDWRASLARTLAELAAAERVPA